MGRRSRKAWLVGALLLVAGGCAAAVAEGVTVSLAMLDRIEPGRWELHSRTPGEPTESLCLANGRRLVQLRHPGYPCESYIVEDRPDQVIVQYTCRGRGYGRTHIRRENSRLVQIETQGIAQGAPFDVAVEARKVGTCPVTLP